MKITEPYPKGTIVHHCGVAHSVGRDPEHPNGGLRGGWGTVCRWVKESDGTYEYEVSKDRSFSGLPYYADGPLHHLSWWGSHHINKALPAESDR